mmetsp:Transcript_44469/g.32582  ORF Transcript_44469/g.32582 Transcript_44469/m.32582 type:complete len:91 (+) Transcript_44469:580-852(+)
MGGSHPTYMNKPFHRADKAEQSKDASGTTNRTSLYFRQDGYMSSSVVQPPANCNQGRWTKQEHCRFLEALKLYGKEWKKVQHHVKTRTST